jgi:serine/threonine protein kinase
MLSPLLSKAADPELVEKVETPISSKGRKASAPGEDELVGKCLNGTYVVEGVIGEGGMGRVYRARHTRLGQKYFAIKMLRPELVQNAEVVARFRREAEAAARISHPNVVGVYDVDTSEQGSAYLVCELLQGMDLADLLERDGQVDVLKAVHIAIQICRALEAAHSCGVLHRDLKPQNVFLLTEESGAVPARPTTKVVDFGLSRLMNSTDKQLTQTGIIMGTPSYMSPEQASAKPTDERSDVYGVGAILYTSLTGSAPFDADGIQGVLMAVLTEEPAPPRASNPAIPPLLELVIQRAMAKSPAERFQNVSELRKALEPFAESGKQSPLPEGREPGSEEVRSKLDADDQALRTARPKLVLYGLLSLLLLATGLSSSLPTVELLTGKFELSNSEVALVLIGVSGTLLTPFVLLVVSIRKTIWRNHARVLELLDRMRSALLVGVVAYGCAGLFVRLLDNVVARFDVSPLLGHPPGIGWAGWDALFFVVASSSALLCVLGQRRALSRDASLVRRVVGRLILVAIPLLALAVLYLGFVWRSAS